MRRLRVFALWPALFALAIASLIGLADFADSTAHRQQAPAPVAFCHTNSTGLAGLCRDLPNQQDI